MNFVFEGEGRVGVIFFVSFFGGWRVGIVDEGFKRVKVKGVVLVGQERWRLLYLTSNFIMLLSSTSQFKLGSHFSYVGMITSFFIS